MKRLSDGECSAMESLLGCEAFENEEGSIRLSVDNYADAFKLAVYENLQDKNPEKRMDWSKNTVQYVLREPSKILSMIRSFLRGYGTLFDKNYDAQDIMADLIIRLGEVDDFDEIKAANGRTGRVTIEVYIKEVLRYMLKSRVNSKSIEQNKTMRLTKTENGTEIPLEIEDTQRSKDYEHVMANSLFEEACKECEPYRYIGDDDIYEKLYLVSLTVLYDKSPEFLKNLCRFLNINNQKSVSNRRIEQLIDSLPTSKEEAIEVLRDRVYMSRELEKLFRYTGFVYLDNAGYEGMPA